MDPRWYAFAEVCRSEFAKCEFQAELVAQCGGAEDIAWAAFFHLGGNSIAWLHRAIPALNGRIPADLIAAGKGDQVRHCLWRMQ